MLNLQHAASCLPGGRVISGGVSFQGIGHRTGDMSARLLPDPDARNGYIVTSFAGDDPLMLRDYVDERCGLPRWEDRTREREERVDPRELARQERAREQQRLAREAEAAIKAERVRRIWDEAERDPRNGLVERYLNQHRKLDLPASICGHAVRFHPRGPWENERAPLMLCALRDIHTNEVVGLHRTRLDPVSGEKLGRKMLGRASGAAIKLTADSEVTMGLALAEGVESALAGMVLGLVPMWATGGVGGIAAFPVLSGIEALTVCAETGAASETAVEQVGTRWSDAGREVRICRPRHGSDLNDAIKEGRP
ncbi:toprim domain-containing protein [Methylobacterium sp. E-046]|nr:toprim domain-containing protein [Methylobacterium sp. E-046]